jgi:ribosomal silencing factor RsfS
MMDLGTFETPEQAHDAFVYASEWHAIEHSPEQDVAEKPVKKYKGVWYHTGPATFEAVLEHNGQELSGGQYPTAEEAAAAYDALARMYAGEGADTNFDGASQYADWVAPTATPKGDLAVPTVPGAPLTLEEVESIVRSEGGVDVVTYDVREKFEHFVGMGVSHVVFVTGRTVGHMRRMGDHVIKAITRRRLRPGPGMAPNWGVEGRAQDHWMVVDTGAVWVSIFEAEHRAASGVDEHFATARLGDMDVDVEDYDAWVEANPIPDAYQALLDRDDEEIQAKYALKKLQKKAKAARKASKQRRPGGAPGSTTV